MCSYDRAAIVALAVGLAAVFAVPGVVAGPVLTAEASPATLGNGTLSAYEYEFTRNSTFVLEERVEAANGTLTLRGTGRAVEYRRTVELGPVGIVEGSVFGLVSVPAFDRNGSVLNPIQEFENPELAALLEERFPQVSIGRPVGNATVTMLGNETTVTRFRGTADVRGATVGVNVYVAHVRSGADSVVATAVHPRLLGDQSERFSEMMGAVEHPGADNATAA